MESGWLNLDQYREVKLGHNGKLVVIRPRDMRAIVPLLCPLCEFPMRHAEDSLAYREFGCCSHCDLQWHRTRAAQWQDGWRPDVTSVEWTAYIQDRRLLDKPNIVLK